MTEGWSGARCAVVCFTPNNLRDRAQVGCAKDARNGVREKTGRETASRGAEPQQRERGT
jgi:hypothetical protein